MSEGNGGVFSRDFAFWVSARFISNTARNMMEVAVAWDIYRVSGSAMALGFLGLAEAIPFLVVSLWAGHLVDRHHKKPFMLGAAGGLFLCAALFFAFTYLPRAPLFPIYLVVGLSGACVSFGSIASTVYLQMLVPGEGFSRAAAWNLASFTGAAILGPLLGGWILSAASARFAYVVCVGAFTASMLLISGLRFRPPRADAPQEESTVRRVREGIRFVRSQPLILACMSLDMVAVLFGDAVAIFPIFAGLLHAGAFGFGLLRAAPSLGSALISLVQASRPFIRPVWRSMKFAVVVFGLCMIAFALQTHLAAAIAFLIVGGAADGFSVIIRQNVYQSRTPDSLRGRVSALSGIFVSTSNEIGAFESGLAAHLLGPIPSVILGGCVTLASVFFMGWKFKGVEKE